MYLHGEFSIDGHELAEQEDTQSPRLRDDDFINFKPLPASHKSGGLQKAAVWAGSWVGYSDF